MGLTLNGERYLVGGSQQGFFGTTPFYESNDCTGQAYALASYVENSISRPYAIAPIEADVDETNETFFIPDTDRTVSLDIFSGWNPFDMKCESTSFTGDAHPLVPIFNLSSKFVRPYSIR